MAEEKVKREDDLFARLFPGLGGAFTGPSFSNYNLGGSAAPGTEGDRDQRKLRELAANLWREQLATEQAIKGPEAYRERLQAFSEYQDPVAHAQGQQQARLARDPWGPGGQFEGRRAADLYTPEQIVASGGMTAENQLRSQQKKTDTFDPEELKRLNEQHRRTYV
jgi:hypothetical protein